MTKPCVVPQCKTGLKSLKIKCSVFKVPSNSERLKKWQIQIPSKQLTPSHYVCEKHFEEKYILRKYIGRDANGKVIAEVQYKHPRLTESAIPTIFVESSQKSIEGCNSPTIINSINDCTENCGNSSENRVDLIPEHDSSIQSVPRDEFLVPMDICTTVLCDVPAKEIVHDHCYSSTKDIPIHAAKSPHIITTPGDTDVLSHPVVADTTFELSPVTISSKANSSSAHFEDSVDCVKSLPVPWVVGQLSAQPDRHGQCLVFLYPEITRKRGIEIPITAKTVTVDGKKNLRYYVHGNLVNSDKVNLPQKLDSLTDVPDILVRFQRMTLCRGVGELNVHFLPTKECFKNYSDEWHHRACSLLWRKRRCENCCRLRKSVLQREKRSKILQSCYDQLARLSNPVNKHKIHIIKKKIKCVRNA